LWALASFQLDLRLRERGAKDRQQLRDDGPAAFSAASRASQPTLGFDLWALAVPVLAVFGTQFARDEGWLGNNAAGKTDAIVILGVVLIASVGRLWWRNRRKNRQTTEAQEEE
jgi:hypothetical protein